MKQSFKKSFMSLLILLVLAFNALGVVTPAYAAPALTWNTFLGRNVNSIAVDGNGNVYVTGISQATWGAPLQAYSGGYDIFVAKMDSSGNLLWNTFLGHGGYDGGDGIKVDSNGNVYVTGRSNGDWGSPIQSNSGSGDAFVAKLDTDGALVWNTFVGGGGSDYANSIAVDGNGDIYIGGYSDATWGSPVQAITTSTEDAFAAKLDSSGALTWNTFLGGSGMEEARSIAVDGSGNVYMTGFSNATWGSPVRAYSADADAFAAKLDSSGALTWNTFLGQSLYDESKSIAVDGSGNIYITGYSKDTWDTPIRAFTVTPPNPPFPDDSADAFVAKLDSSGAVAWNTFLGGADADYGYSITFDSGNVYVTGTSIATWGNPSHAFNTPADAFAAKLNSSGNLTWNTFIGGTGDDDGSTGFARDGNIYVAGLSYSTWGTPVRAFASELDGVAGFVAKIVDPYIVTKAEDTNDSVCDTDCSLREAITAANANSGADTIQFNGDFTITLNASLPTITADLTIDGTGHTIIISGDNGARVMAVDNTLNLNGVEVANGYAANGAGITVHNGGILNVTSSTFSGNSDGGTGAGGAIYNVGTVTVTNSTFNGNSAINGGGVYNAGTLTVNNSTFSGNSSGISNDASGTMNLYNTIIANSTGADCSNSGAVGTEKNNLIEADSASPNNCGDAAHNDILGVDPILSSFDYHGGRTPSFRLHVSSPAINAGDNITCGATDQRGVTRPDGGVALPANCDMGAYEYSPANVDVIIGGADQGAYIVNPQGSHREIYALDSGPVQVKSTNGVPIIAAVRDAWLVNGGVTSFSQLMGLPQEQLSDTYYFPAYNNVTLSGQLRIGNVDTVATDVTVTIAGVDRGTYHLEPNQSVRPTYTLDAGPVIVKSSNGAKIIAALRDAWLVNGQVRSFVQLMGLPKESLSDTYWLPAYNNVTLSGQLRIGNVDAMATTVTVKIGGVVQGTYPLNPNESVRPTYALDSGPVEVYSDNGAKIIVAIRDAWLVNGQVTSFSQLMGLPKEKLSDTYLLPAYNNMTLSGQLRIANVDSISTTVTVTIGGVVQGTYTLASGEGKRVTYALDNGPVEVTSSNGAKIIVALRDAWLVNGQVTSFVQLMGLPKESLSTTYWFPAYNNVTLSGQLRFANP